MERISRRTLFRFGTALSAGIATDMLTDSVITKTGNIFHERTGLQTGNANNRQEISDACKTKRDTTNCSSPSELSPLTKVRISTLNPLVEEVVFRAYPSAAVSDLERSESKGEDVVWGTRKGLGMTRREVITGAVSSVIFGFAHNITDTHVDTKTVPVELITYGGFQWYLQRKLGFFAPLASHVLQNISVATGIRK